MPACTGPAYLIPLQAPSVHIIALPIERFSFLPGTLRYPGEQCSDQGCPATPVCSGVSCSCRRTLNSLRHLGLAHPHFKELTCAFVSTQCQPPWLGSLLSSRTQRSPAQPGVACLLYLGAVAHVAARVHLQCYYSSTREQNRALPHKCCLAMKSQGDLQTAPRREAPPKGKLLLGIRSYPRIPAVPRPRVATASSLSASLQVLGSPDARWPRFLPGRGRVYSPLPSVGRGRQPWSEVETQWSPVERAGQSGAHW